MTTWGLLSHFFSDLVHFDGKYFDTMRTLFSKPGHLSRAFMQGRRASYVDPVKMYIFTSAGFFLLLYTFFLKIDEKGMVKEMQAGIETPASLVRKLNESDSGRNNYHLLNGYIIRNDHDTLVRVEDQPAMRRFRDSIAPNVRHAGAAVEIDATDGNFLNISGITDHEDRHQYDSIQQQLPAASRDNWLKRFLVYRQFVIQEEYKGEPGRYLAHVLEKFVHSLPTVMFISLPFLALLLKLLYIRRRNFHFPDHGIFLIHTYIFTYLYLLLFFLANRLAEATGWDIWGPVKGIMLCWLLWYVFRSMRVFYGQSGGKTAGKIFIFLSLSLVILSLVFGLYFVYTALKG